MIGCIVQAHAGIDRPATAEDIHVAPCAARLKAREIFDQPSQENYAPIIENWRQLPDGQIEFTMWHLPTTDETDRLAEWPGCAPQASRICSLRLN
jgi:hypothetical protein